MLNHTVSEVRLPVYENQTFDTKFEVKIESLDVNDEKFLITKGKIVFKVYPFNDIEFIKHILIKRLKGERKFKVKDIEIFYNGIELKNKQVLVDFTDFEDLVFNWRIRKKIAKHLSTHTVELLGNIKVSNNLKILVEDINYALAHDISPSLTLQGTGATYIMYNISKRPIGVFKPIDEEAFTPFNPRGYKGKLGQKGFRSGVFSGEGAYREVAAYFLDAYYDSFSNVPPAVLIESIHPKFCYSTAVKNPMIEQNEFLCEGLILKRKTTSSLNDKKIKLHFKVGSLQQFVDSAGCCSDFDYNMFGIGDVHKIAILDIRLCNMDRNEGNILVLKEENLSCNLQMMNYFDSKCVELNEGAYDFYKITTDGEKSKFRLIPIDHGLTLPSNLDITDFDLTWLSWSQTQIPLSEQELKYIEFLNPEKDAIWLNKKLQIRSECLRTMIVCTKLLQKGAKNGLNLFQIASCMVKFSPSRLSNLENSVKLATSQACYILYANSTVQKAPSGNRIIMDLLTSKSTENHKNIDYNHKEEVNNKLKKNNKNLQHSQISSELDPNSFSSSRTTGYRPQIKNSTAILHNLKTNFRFTEIETENLWTTTGFNSRVIFPDWENKDFCKTFYLILDRILDYMTKQEFKKSELRPMHTI